MAKLLTFFHKLIDLSVWDRDGIMYSPVWNHAYTEVSHYAPYVQAFDQLVRDFKLHNGEL